MARIVGTALELDGVPAARLAQRWGVPQCGVFARLTSSLDVIHELGAQGAPAGTVVLAEEQTAGRGRDGRTWHSPPGGVWLGMLFRPEQTDLSAFALRAGLVLADVVAERDWLRGRQLRAPCFGRAAGVRPDGALLVDTGPATAGIREGHVELA